MLNPMIKPCTGGNSASFIEIAVEEEDLEHIKEIAARFVEDESSSDDYGFALKTGFTIPDSLRIYGNEVRLRETEISYTKQVAEENDVYLTGKRGRIGALAAVAFRGLETDILLNPSEEII